MDIVAESLSAGTLKTKNVTVRGKDIIEWFESKLSASVSFVGVFPKLSDAPKKNGAVAIVGSKDYIYSEAAGKWQEFGDEGQIGAILQAIEQLSNSLSNIVVDETDPVFRELSGNFLTEVPPTYMTYAETSNSLSADGYALKTDIPSAADISSEIHLSGYSLTSHNHDGTYMEKVPNTYKTYDATVSSLSADGYALTSDISDIPAIKQDVAVLGAVSSEYQLAAEAGSMAYEDRNDYLAAERKSFVADSTNSTASDGGNYSGFQLKLSAFAGYDITDIALRRGAGSSDTLAGTELSIIGTTAWPLSNATAGNTYFVSDGTATYPQEAGGRYGFKLRRAGGEVPADGTMYFFFVNGNSGGAATARLNVYKYSTTNVAVFLHPQSGWFVEITVNARRATGSMAYENKDDYTKKSETSSAQDVQQALNGKQPAGNYLSVSALDDYYSASETSSAQEIETALNGKQPSGNYLTEHQSLSNYYMKSETSSASELSLCEIGIKQYFHDLLFSTILSTYEYAQDEINNN